MSFDLWKFQLKAIEDCREAIAAGNRRIVLQAPTGSGKTVIAAQIIKSAASKGRRVMFLAHRRELVNQCADKLIKFGVDHGILMAGEELYGAADCQVASINTLWKRCIATDKLPLPNADILFIDECHRSLAPTYLEIIKRYPNAIVVGLTATPIRGDGKGLAHVYDHMVRCPSITNLIRLGHLVQPRTFAPTIPDLTGVKIVRGDYDEAQLERAMNHRKLVGDVVTHWHRLASDRPTIVFASGVKHSINLRDEFVKSGVSAAHVDGTTPLPERKAIIEGLHDRSIQVVTNYGVLTEGFDEPIVSCGVIARPTKNLGLNIQMCGRPLRVSPGKEDCFLIDHSGNVYEHGWVTDYHDWELEEGRALTSTTEKRQREFDEKEPITCTQCMAVYSGQQCCPHCGHVPVKKGRYVETLHGELTELRINKRRTAKARKFTVADREQWYCMFLAYAEDKGYQKGWAAHKYKSKFDEYPDDDFSQTPEDPNAECKSWIRGMNIRYHKGKEKRERLSENAG